MDAMIKDRFVKQVLEHQGARLLRNQGNSLYKKLKFQHGNLETARSVSVSGGDGLDGKLTFRHIDYERFLDMKRTVTTKKGKTKNNSGYRIHNRFIYGHYFAIARQLSVGLTESVKQGIRNELKTEIHG